MIQRGASTGTQRTCPLELRMLGEVRVRLGLIQRCMLKLANSDLVFQIVVFCSSSRRRLHGRRFPCGRLRRRPSRNNHYSNSRGHDTDYADEYGMVRFMI